MKKHEIKTSKGDFLVVDGVGEDFAMDLTNFILGDEWFIKLSEATEEDAKLIVDEPERFFNPTNPYCVDDIIYPNYLGGDRFWFATQSLHSLIKSKGITGDNLYIFNKIK